VETAPAIVRASLRKALQFLKAQFGGIMGDWQWGKIHQLTLAHTLGKNTPFENVFNAGPFAVGGSADTINKGDYRLTAPYAVNAGPSVRLIVDLARPEESWSIIPGGQSGQAFSEHHHDQIKLWLQGEYRRVSMRREAIAANSKNVLVLQPGSTEN
jgi:penicillin amidase